MGNAAWGHGYHQGFDDGAKQGSAITGVVFLGVAGLVGGGKLLYDKLKNRRLADPDTPDVATNTHDGADASDELPQPEAT